MYNLTVQENSLVYPSVDGLPVSCPPHSCDLTPLDFFWRVMLSLVYATRPATLHDLQSNIERVIADIRHELCEKDSLLPQLSN